MIEILQRHGVAHRLQRPSHGFSRSLTAPDMPTVDRRKFLPEVYTDIKRRTDRMDCADPAKILFFRRGIRFVFAFSLIVAALSRGFNRPWTNRVNICPEGGAEVTRNLNYG